ncbi:MAG: type IX secretion system membrane protein PorP/SprF [Bacteroidia bacterium]|nr:type IX secretion system membrane protein PorP/SprF [Bacteroidia bacterium]
MKNIKHKAALKGKTLSLALFMAVLCAVGQVKGQQRMQYTQYLLNGFLTNPALAGSEDYMDLKVGYSHQWAGFQGAPKGIYLTFHTPVGLKEGATPIEQEDDFKTLPLRGRTAGLFIDPGESSGKGKGSGQQLRHGLGGFAFSESMGPITMNGLGASYGIHFPIGSKLRWALGASFGLLQFRLNPANVALNDPNDVAVAASTTNQLLPNLNVGTMLYHRNFFVGGSAKQVLGNKIEMSQAATGQARLVTHYFLTAGVRFFLGSKTELIPSVRFRYVNPAPPSIDFNLSLFYNDLLFGGLTFRPGDAAAAQLGFVIKNRLLVSYSYDYTISGLSTASSGTHGIVLGFRLGIKGKDRGRAFYW